MLIKLPQAKDPDAEKIERNFDSKNSIRKACFGRKLSPETYRSMSKHAQTLQRWRTFRHFRKRY